MTICLTAQLFREYPYWNFGQSYPMEFIFVSNSWPFWGNHLFIIFPKPWDHKSNNESHNLLSMMKIKEPGGGPIICLFCQWIAERILGRVGSMCNNAELGKSIEDWLGNQLMLGNFTWQIQNIIHALQLQRVKRRLNIQMLTTICMELLKTYTKARENIGNGLWILPIWFKFQLGHYLENIVLTFLVFCLQIEIIIMKLLSKLKYIMSVKNLTYFLAHIMSSVYSSFD